MGKEENKEVKFKGWIVDLFICDNGNLGMTIEKEKPEPVDKMSFMDIYVRKDLSGCDYA